MSPVHFFIKNRHHRQKPHSFRKNISISGICQRSCHGSSEMILYTGSFLHHRHVTLLAKKRQYFFRKVNKRLCFDLQAIFNPVNPLFPVDHIFCLIIRNLLDILHFCSANLSMVTYGSDSRCFCVFRAHAVTCCVTGNVIL